MCTISGQLSEVLRAERKTGINTILVDTQGGSCLGLETLSLDARNGEQHSETVI